MSFIIDLIIIAIIFLFTFLGHKRGLVKVAFKLCTFFIAIVVAFLLFKPVASLVIEKTTIDENIENAITIKILPKGVVSAADENAEIQKTLPEIIVKNSQNTVQSVAETFSTTLIESACFLLIFIVVKIGMRFITALADLIAKLPLLKQFNELGGTIYGILEGLFIVFVGFAIVSLTAPLLDNSLLIAINNSLLGSIFYNNNILLKVLI